MALQATQSVFISATSSITTLAAPADPLLELPTRDALVYLALDRGLPIGQVAEALAVTAVEPGNPLLRLTPRQALVFLGKARGLPMPRVAEALGISRQAAYQLLDKARAALEPIAASRTGGDRAQHAG